MTEGWSHEKLGASVEDCPGGQVVFMVEEGGMTETGQVSEVYYENLRIDGLNRGWRRTLCRIKVTKLSVEIAHASGGTHLLCTGHQKVCIQSPHIHWHIGNGLTGVYPLTH